MSHKVHYFKAGGLMYRIGYPITWLVFKCLWFYRSFNTKRLPPTGGAILASNHASHFDPVLVGLTSFRPVKFLARESLFYNPFFGRLISSLGAFPIMRAKAPEGATQDDAAAHAVGSGHADGKSFTDHLPSTDMRALRTAIDLLKDGHRLVMFPEGTRSPTGHIRKFQPGVAMMFLRAQVPLVPIYLHGNHRVFPRGAKTPHVFRSIKVFVGEPIRFEEIPAGMRSKKQHEWILNELRTRILALQKEAWERYPLPALPPPEESADAPPPVAAPIPQAVNSPVPDSADAVAPGAVPAPLPAPASAPAVAETKASDHA
ncbi:MAG TPA: lysophospholipid acyltransferase family protein [Planctomycetota bacterium]|nr:lysophospholipid acyltransferase family protein [Planctomycetota bacterium]